MCFPGDVLLKWEHAPKKTRVQKNDKKRQSNKRIIGNQKAREKNICRKGINYTAAPNMISFATKKPGKDTR